MSTLRTPSIPLAAAPRSADERPKPRFPKRNEPAPDRKLTPSETLEASRGGLAFGMLVTFTLVLYARPGDLYRPLATAHLAELAALGAISTYGLSLVFGQPRFYRSKELWIVAALTALFVIGVPFAFWRSGAMTVLTDLWLKTALIFFLLTQTTTTIHRLRILLWSIILCMFVVSTYSALNPQMSYTFEGRLMGATTGFLSGNYLGVAVGSMLPFIALFFMKTRSWSIRLLLAVTVLLLMWQMILTASRSNLMQITLSMTLIWFLFLRQLRGARILAAVVVIAMTIFLASAPAVFWNRMQTLWTGEVEQNWQSQSAKFSEEQRENLFWRSIEYTIEDPLLGVGLGNFSIKSGNMTGRASEWLGTHNTYTQISSEAGIPALLLYVALLYGSLRAMLRISRATEKQPGFEDFFFFSRAMMVGLLVFAFAGFFAHLGYDYYFYYLVGIGTCLKGCYQRATEGPEDQRAKPPGVLLPRMAR